MSIQINTNSKLKSINEAIGQKKFKSEFQKAMVNILFTSSFANGLNMQILKPYGLSAQQYNILRILRGQHPKAASVNLLIDRMLDKNSNVSRLVEKLRIKNLVERKNNELDRRQVDILITESGLKLLKEIDVKMIALDNRTGDFTIEDAESLNYLLDKYRNNFSKE